MHYFSNNIIFLDTEFTTFDVRIGEILSIGLVKLTGEELYLELEYTGEVSQWVKENLLHTLTGKKVSQEEARKKIIEFVGETKPYMVAYVDNFDSIYWSKLFYGYKEGEWLYPFNWIAIDFSSILFAHGIDPESYHNAKDNLMEKLGIDQKKYQLHHALDDAKALRETYLAVQKLPEKP